MKGAILLLFHCRTNTGYAIGELERAFHTMALRLTGDESAVHYGYPSLSGGFPSHLPPTFDGVSVIDPDERDPGALEEITNRVRQAGIALVFAFDLPLAAPVLGALRRGGVTHIVSYWGASISSPYPWWLRPLRKAQYVRARHRPDHFIFESEGMRRGAVLGAAIPTRETSVRRLGVDVARFYPPTAPSYYAHQLFGIPESRRIVFFSGHMEPRKGVRVLVESMMDLVNVRGRRDVHLLVLGNQPGEEGSFLPLIEGTPAQQYVTFGGYRSDIPELHRSAYLGAIASTGWDSFTLSAVEMAASGLPLIVSDLPGLSEAVEHGVTGRLFPAGDARALATSIERLVDAPAERDRLGASARQRVLREFTREAQEEGLVAIVRSVLNLIR
jgi:glycosyltransferase involved in cell wall biosynthesis